MVDLHNRHEIHTNTLQHMLLLINRLRNRLRLTGVDANVDADATSFSLLALLVTDVNSWMVMHGDSDHICQIFKFTNRDNDIFCTQLFTQSKGDKVNLFCILFHNRSILVLVEWCLSDLLYGLRL